MILMIHILLACNCKLTGMQTFLIVLGSLQASYMFLVFLHLMNAGYKSKWKFIFDLFFPFGAVVRKTCMGIAQMVNQIKRLK